MGRLHPHKRVVQLAEAWVSSLLNNDTAYELIIAGPDDGELKKLKTLLKKSSNAFYTGAVYKDQKEQLINKSNFFTLTAIGEGLAVSTMENPGKGLIPIITEGCNFPEVLENAFAIKTGIKAKQIRESLEYGASLDMNTLENMSNNLKTFMKDHYSFEIIARQQFELYTDLLKNVKD